MSDYSGLKSGYAEADSAMLILYTIAPLLYRMASSAFYNISLLSVNFFGLLFGLGLYVRVVPQLIER